MGNRALSPTPPPLRTPPRASADADEYQVMGSIEYTPPTSTESSTVCSDEQIRCLRQLLKWIRLVDFALDAMILYQTAIRNQNRSIDPLEAKRIQQIIDGLQRNIANFVRIEPSADLSEYCELATRYEEKNYDVASEQEVIFKAAAILPAEGVNSQILNQDLNRLLGEEA